MTYYARIDGGIAVKIHTVADAVTDGPGLLSGLWGGKPADYIHTGDTHPGRGAAWDGKKFTAPDPPPDPVAEAYERGKADGAAEQVALTVAEAL